MRHSESGNEDDGDDRGQLKPLLKINNLSLIVIMSSSALARLMAIPSPARNKKSPIGQVMRGIDQEGREDTTIVVKMMPAETIRPTIVPVTTLEGGKFTAHLAYLL